MNVSLASSKSSIKQPRELYNICVASLWSFLSFYGMRAMLITYLVTQLLFKETYSYSILGVYFAMIFILPFFGGMLADKVLGLRKAIVWGSFLQVLGHACLLLTYQHSLFAGLAFNACGSGFFIAADSALIGTLYTDTEAESRDAGYSIFYVFSSMGAALGGLICGYVGQSINWKYGFALAGTFSLMACLHFAFGVSKKVGAVPSPEKLKRKVFLGLNLEVLIYLTSFLVVAVIVVPFYFPTIMDAIMPSMVVLALYYVVVSSLQLPKQQRWKIAAALVTFLVWAFFLAMYEQSGGALNLFVIRNVNMQWGDLKFSGLALNNFLPGFFLLFFTPLAFLVWKRLHLLKLEPSTVVKFEIGFLFIAAFFGLLWLGCHRYRSSGILPVAFLIGGYLLMVCGEVCIGPVVYAATSKLSPANMTSTMMGMLSITASLGVFMAAKIGKLTSIPKEISDPVQSMPYYSHTFGMLAVLCVVASVVLLVLYPLLKKWMQDVR
ncbi:peptide MFS transporter [Pontibacter harenae]|uniref:peptide MFS transporter n=1 Tax=Pontibacter harenae TaxID=2894083 RepID=UPI001E48FA33|nr:oligopeptide:H+ symporter [Pontibacter harenae]MCC9167635.1 oligopeptide:H+ symporter [Pontibacter harenae]